MLSLQTRSILWAIVCPLPVHCSGALCIFFASCQDCHLGSVQCVQCQQYIMHCYLSAQSLLSDMQAVKLWVDLEIER